MKEWVVGELITAEDLNALERAAADAAEGVGLLDGRVTAVESESASTAAVVDGIKLANQSAGTGAPTGSAPVGWVYTDLSTGDIYRMEA